MENPGLVTFSANILLVPPNASADQRRRAAGVTSHELAHMWFGNLITPRDWNDLWLNEGFATWLSDKMVGAYQPAQAREILDIADKSTAFESDHDIGGRVVREPVSSLEDIRNSFDAITYRKGGALLTMIEAWLGEDLMKKAVRNYLHAHSGGSVTAPDLVNALHSSAPNKAVEKIFKSFLTQAGIPSVTATLDCDAKTVVELEQSRHVPISVRSLAQGADLDTLWQIPTCLRYPTEDGVVRQCVLLRKKKQRVRLRTKKCPAWILPNDRDSGYYHYLLDSAGFDALASAGLDPRERLGLVHNLIAALESGTMGVGTAMDRLEPYAQAGGLAVQQAVIPLLYLLEQSVVGEAEHAAFSERVRLWYGKRLATLGLASRSAESELDQQFRPVLIHLLSELGDDQDLQQKARTIIDAWLEKREPMDLQLLDALLQAAASRGDAKLAKRYQEGIEKSEDRRHSAVLLGGLHAFRDPRVFESALDLSIPMQFQLPNLVPVVMRAMATPSLRKILLDRLIAKRDALLAGTAPNAAATSAPAGNKEQRERRLENFDRLAPIFARLCDAEGVALVKSFAGEEFDAQAIVEAIEGCMAFASAQGASARAAWAATPK
jgi:alanyl aminopeptidase